MSRSRDHEVAGTTHLTVLEEVAVASEGRVTLTKVNVGAVSQAVMQDIVNARAS